MIYLVRVITLEGNGPNLFIVVPLLVAIVLTGIPEYKWQSGESKGAHLVTYVSGVTDSDLKCQRMMGTFYDWTPRENASVDKTNPKVVQMKYDECISLVDWFSADPDKEPATSKQAYALHLLIFEALKVGANSKISDLDAECKATAKFIDVATYAGASTEQANRMLNMYKTDWYPSLPEALRQPCQ